ncbi:hypothetical protein, partial [uncultured Bradyrhizobium sp.]|uniref:hypothetical protein n=1 Tax=uncultured Bradyrhizobium sp. TaxID=199684 RepID=UPI0035CAC677
TVSISRVMSVGIGIHSQVRERRFELRKADQRPRPRPLNRVKVKGVIRRSAGTGSHEKQISRHARA